MTFQDAFASDRGPSIISLYEFRLGPALYFRYTDGDEDVIFNGETFAPAPLSYTEASQEGTLSKESVKVAAQYSLAPAKAFRIDPPSYVSTLTIWEGHFSDVDQEFQQVWAGRILNVRVERESAEFTCETESTSLTRPGSQRRYQRPCPHALYGPLCRAVEVQQAVSWVSGSSAEWTVTRPATGYHSAGSYAAGRVLWDNENGDERQQTILAVVESGPNLVLTVNKALAAGGTPTNLRIVKGCNRTETACADWHDNIWNFGGCPFIPNRTPLNKFSEFY